MNTSIMDNVKNGIIFCLPCCPGLGGGHCPGGEAPKRDIDTSACSQLLVSRKTMRCSLMLCGAEMRRFESELAFLKKIDQPRNHYDLIINVDTKPGYTIRWRDFLTFPSLSSLIHQKCG